MLIVDMLHPAADAAIMIEKMIDSKFLNLRIFYISFLNKFFKNTGTPSYAR
jgi:hypothetical protein